MPFVYQRLEADATLTVKLITATGDAGLMVQEANETSSAYVFVGVKDNQLQVIQGGDTQTVHDARVANNPVWVRLEKKEDRVEVFQSDDNINFSLVTTVAMTLANPFNMGMAIGATGQVGQVQVSDVVLAQATTGELPEYKDQGLIGAEGGVVYIENDQGEEIAFVSLEPGFLKEQVLVTMEEIPDSPAGGYDYLRFSEDEIITPIGPRVAISFPYSAINIESEAELITFITPYDGMYDGDKQNLYEIQISLGDEQVFFNRNRYSVNVTPGGVGGTSISTPGVLYSYPPFSNIPPETYKMIAQPLSITRPEQDQNSLPQNSIVTQGRGYDPARGLFFVTDDYTAQDGVDSCVGNRGGRTRNETMPASIIDVNSNLPDIVGKTPLILIHGWQVGEETSRIIANTFLQSDSLDDEVNDKIAQRSFAPSFCEWLDFINNYAPDDAINIVDSIPPETKNLNQSQQNCFHHRLTYSSYHRDSDDSPMNDK